MEPTHNHGVPPLTLTIVVLLPLLLPGGPGAWCCCPDTHTLAGECKPFVVNINTQHTCLDNITNLYHISNVLDKAILQGQVF